MGTTQSSTSLPKKIINQYTTQATPESASIAPLAQQEVLCPNNGALNSIKYNRLSGNTFQYGYNCSSDWDNTDKTSCKSTVFQLNRNNQAFALGDHSLICDNGSVMTGFQMEANADAIRYNYKCAPQTKPLTCRRRSTPPNDSGQGDMVYLDRHNIQCGEDEVLSFLKLVNDSSDKYHFEYSCCRNAG